VSGGLIRGLYCGAGLCAEAAHLLAERLGQVTSNVRLSDAVPFDAASGARAHACIDLGDPGVRAGAPHPMVDPLVRTRALAEVAADPRIRVVLLDVVLGYGVHPDPVGALAESLGALLRTRPQVSVLAHVVGTEHDPQGLAEQERRLSELGVRVLTSNAAAARMAAALVG
jgi:FdrA protein